MLHDVHDFGVSVVVLVRGLQHGRGGQVGNAQVSTFPVKPFDEGNRRAIEVNATGIGRRDTRCAREMQRQHFGPGNVDGVVDARELADGQLAVFIQQGAFGTHTAKRGALALQVAQVFGGFRARLDCTRCLVHPLKLNQRRRRAPTFSNRT